MTDQFGTDEGQLCRRDGCCARIEIKPTENCLCHINPPCSGCVEAPLWCPDCGWEAQPIPDNRGE
jgi:hypothetical protein